MSLQLAAQHMASRGRGPDTTLVHMAPQEVAGLQALAKAHGGSLTVNPDTGLPEAGFLSSILPMIAGAALAATGVGAPLAAAMVGGGYGIATGSLSKGLMAGLGAFGGAGLAGGLMSAGAAGAGAAGAGAGAGAAGAMVPQTAAQLGAGFESAMAAQGITPTIGATGASMGAQTAGQLGAGFQNSMAAQGLTPTAVNPIQPLPAPVQTVTQIPTFSDNISQMGRGIENLGSVEGRTAFMGNAASKGVEAAGVGGGSGLAKYGLAAAAPMLMQDPKKLEEKEKLEPFVYSYDPGRVEDPNEGYTGAYTGQRRYFNPTFTRTAADGGLMGLGPVQAMSDRNDAQMMLANRGQMFAEGGETKAVKPVEQDPYYTMSGQSGDAFKYLMGQMPARAPEVAIPKPVHPPISPPTLQPINKTSPSDATLRPYTFDPVTGTFTAMPIIKPVSPESTTMGYRGGSGGGGSNDGYGNYSGFGPSNTSYTGYSDSLAFAGQNSAAPVGSIGMADGFGGYGSFGLSLSDNASPGSSDAGNTSDAAADGGGRDSSGAPYAHGGIASLAQGGQSHLGDYSDGGRLLKGPGDGVSDSIPATIADKRPARLADGEFVVPARIVSELGNGSTEAGARKLYAMMDRVQKARKQSIGKNRVAVNSRAEKMLPA